MNKDEDFHSLYSKHQKVQYRWVSGFYQNIRVITIWVTLGIYFLAPWVTWHHHQALLFDLSHRRFNVLGFTFWPQDFFLLTCALIVAALSLIVITNIAGRIWCGYTCPQTVWTRFFMWIEYVTEGDRNKRIKRNQQPWLFANVIARCGKHTLWLLLSFATAVTFVGFFTPIRTLLHEFVTGTLGFFEIFWMIFFTSATYLNAGWMREQVCLYMCPYARFQSVMVDKDTWVVAYDSQRGEPRGSRSRDAKPTQDNLGDCVNCQVCVQVCPTGIDIRDGLQMGCIGCAACIDGCDQVMEKLQFPTGLIRYATENNIQKKSGKFLRPRLLASVGVLLVMITLLLTQLVLRIPLRLDVLHDRQNLYRENTQQQIENYYILKIDNMSQQDNVYQIDLESDLSLDYVGPKTIAIPAGEVASIPVTLQMARSANSALNTTIKFIIHDTTNADIKAQSLAHFIVPSK